MEPKISTQPIAEKKSSYRKWIETEGIPLIEGFFIEDLTTMALYPWERKGGLGARIWQEGSLFSPPLNSWYRHFNGSGDQPARYFAVTSAPLMINLLHNVDFIFNCDYVFKDRYNDQENYFSGEGNWYAGRIWETNFVPDVKNLKLLEWKERGAGGSQVRFEISENTMCAHVSQFPVGTYKKAHFHGPGAHVVILGGQGYSLMYP